jgi:Major Facilitator Superfamily
MDDLFPPLTRTSTIRLIQDPQSYELRYINQDFLDKHHSLEFSGELNMSTTDLPSPASLTEEKAIDDKASPSASRKRNVFAGKSPRFWIAFAVLNLTAFISALDAVIIAAALPAITQELGGTSNQAFWSGTAFLLAATITQPLFGTFSEIFGRRVNLMFALIWFLVGSILCARSTYMGMFIGSRVVWSSILPN